MISVGITVMERTVGVRPDVREYVGHSRPGPEAARPRAGGDLPSLTQAMRDRERRRAHLETELRGLDELARVSQIDMEALERELTALLKNWRALLAKHTPQARQILRKLLDGRLHAARRGRRPLLRVHRKRGAGPNSRGFSAGDCQQIQRPKAVVAPTGFERLWRIEVLRILEAA